MAIGDEPGIILWGECSFPDKLCYEISFSEQFTADMFQIVLLIVINRNEDYSVICKKVFCDLQARVNHVQPVSVETPVAFGVGYETIPQLVKLTGVLKISRFGFCEIVFIHKIVARVVRRVDVYHLDFMQVCLLKAFEDIKIVALDIEIVCLVEVQAFFPAWSERSIDWGIGEVIGSLFVGPGELVSFLRSFNNFS